MSELMVSVLVVAGAVFTFIGSLGLVRLRDFYCRLHGPTKATTLGVGCLLLASAIWFSSRGAGLSLHEVLIALFLFITAPVSAHLLAKAALHLRLASLAFERDVPANPANGPEQEDQPDPVAANPIGDRGERLKGAAGSRT